MKTTLALLVVALTVAAVAARCPNSCSGHGNCGRYDKCTCWPNWQGNDCSLRTCAFDNAWALDKFDPHYYAECSNKGICDRATGECDCFDCYEGRACTRSSCPNGCSGHGKCRYINELSTATTYAGWDAAKIQACVCDGGYYGPDCSQRYCPMGDDPMTVCDSENTNIQTVDIAFDHSTVGMSNDVRGASLLANDELVLSFTDPHGEVWYTQKIQNVFGDDDVATATAIKEALTALPNKIIPAMHVSADNATDSRRSWQITFDDPRNAGQQNLIGCHITGCQSAGCQPFYKQIRLVTGGTTAASTAAEYAEVAITSDSIFDALAHAGTGGMADPDYKVFVTTYDNSSAVKSGGVLMPGHDYQAVIVPYADAWTAAAGDELDESDATGAVSVGEATKWDAHISELHTLNWHGGRKRIPVEFTHVNVGSGVYVAFGSRKPTARTWVFLVTTPACTVTHTQNAAANKENAQCSNRGECDASSGVCACHEGYYGDNCQSQTILV